MTAPIEHASLPAPAAPHRPQPAPDDDPTRARRPRWPFRRSRWAVRRRVRQGVIGVGPTFFVALALISLALRATVRDRYDLLATLYYATPPPLMAAACTFAMVVFLLQRRRTPSAAAALLVVVCSVWGVAINWMAGPMRSDPPDGADRTRVRFWNMARGVAGWGALIREAARNAPDVVVAVEMTGHPSRVGALWQEALPDHHIIFCIGGVVVAVRGPTQWIDGGYLTGHEFGLYHHLRVASAVGPLDLIVVDISSHLFRDRGPAFDSLNALLASLTDRPVLVVGDFNTPPDSVHYDHLRTRFRNAYEAAGAGWAPTWPMPLPVLAIDQAWLNERAPVRRCDVRHTWLSDHAILDLEIGPE